MHKLSTDKPKKIIGFFCLISTIVFTALTAIQLYYFHEDTPQAPCYSQINFIYSENKSSQWAGEGDMSINMDANTIYLYFKLHSPTIKDYIYSRRFNVEFEKLDSSRFLFKTLSSDIFESDTSEKKLSFMRRIFEGGLITYSRFSETEYYYNINNIFIGVCHVPT